MYMVKVIGLTECEKNTQARVSKLEAIAKKLFPDSKISLGSKSSIGNN